MIYHLNNPDHVTELRRLAKEGGHTVDVDDGNGVLRFYELREDTYFRGSLRGDVLMTHDNKLHSCQINP